MISLRPPIVSNPAGSPANQRLQTNGTGLGKTAKDQAINQDRAQEGDDIVCPFEFGKLGYGPTRGLLVTKFPGEGVAVNQFVLTIIKRKVDTEITCRDQHGPIILIVAHPAARYWLKRKTINRV